MSIFKKLILKFQEVFLKRKRILQYFLTISLLILGLAIYFSLTDEKEKARNGRFDYVNKDLVAGVNLYRLENYERAEVLLKRSLESAKGKKTKSFAALYLGNILYKKGKYTDALELFRESLSYNKKNVFAMYNTALSYLKLGNTSQALRHSLKTFELQNDYLPNLLLLGNMYYGAGKYQKALSIYNTIESDDAILKINKAFTYLNLNNTDLAKSLFKVVIDDPEAD
ncbi:MAG: tetratricopeptide repeat protein, partial [Spirochaetes bacterium]|nr:tetratricopeptide repeat protein [Spirochaetota bacterium]